MSHPMHSIHLSLVSHTNIGKTALARTLLNQDVGEVRDAPHVTEFADGHTLLQPRRATACNCGTRRVLATARGCCAACGKATTRSAGS